MLIQAFQVEGMGPSTQKKGSGGEMYEESVGWEVTQPASYQKKKQKQNRIEHVRLGTDKKLILEHTNIGPTQKKKAFQRAVAFSSLPVFRRLRLWKSN